MTEAGEGFAAVMREAKSRNEMVMQARMGVSSLALMEAMIRASRDIPTGQTVGTITIDAMTRQCRFDAAAEADDVDRAIRLVEKEKLPFSDVTFDNFKTVSISFDRYAHLFEAGDHPPGK